MKKTLKAEKKSFLWAFLLALAIFLPFIIYNGGIFTFIGDFNAQQIPFYKHAHEMVRSGNILWDWGTDLGVNFIGSYSFYLLFSPFFWLTLPFPTDFVPFLMGPLLILKTSLAALTSFLYIKRYVKNESYAVLGSVMYAFSGFMTFNIFFNHFHDVVVFFPLLLLSLDRLAEENKRGFFLFMVAVSALVNYWFFIGEVVFTVIYVVIRMITDENWRSVKKFMLIAMESVMGVGICCCLLLPSALAIMGNPRTGADSMINADLLWVYGFRQRLPAILQSFFFPPEMPSRPSFFPDMGAKWASLSAWLPLFSQVGTIAYLKSRRGRKDTVKAVITVSFVMSLVPVLNSAFVLFNNSYYARWFYMPILFLVIATCTALEERENLGRELKSSFFWVAAIEIIFIAAVGLSPNRSDDDSFRFGFYGDEKMYIFLSLTAVICLLLCGYLLFRLKDSEKFIKLTAVSLSVVTVAFSVGYIADGKGTKANDDYYLDIVLNGREKYALPDDEFYRTDFYNCPNNMGMHLGQMTINAFHSIVPPSIMEFYPYVGIKRDVSSKPPLSHEALRPLMSVKYLFTKSDEQRQPPIKNYTLYKETEDFNIYENPQFIPMGFMYDTAVYPSAFDTLSGEQRLKYMLSSVLLGDEDIEKVKDILKVETEADYSYFNDDMVQKAVDARRSASCYSFETDRNGFTAKIDAPYDGLIFFSVPYDEGWTASVNGKGADIIRANTGFMSVILHEGQNEIRFDYMPQGLSAGLFISAVFIVITAVYLTAVSRKKHNDFSCTEENEEH